jgi:uncharacterized repeat protein (TIGR03803 family)
MQRNLLILLSAATLVTSQVPAQTFTTLYSFTGGADGEHPTGSLIVDAAGNLYSTTRLGGVNNTGTVFKITPSGVKTVLCFFNGGPGGANPAGGVIADAAGNLYGATVYGGTNDFGTVFKVTPSGIQTVLHSFAGGSDGAQLQSGAQIPSGLLADAAGNLYGTTTLGGLNNMGTVFKVTTAGNETVLYSFTGADGAYPLAGLLADAAGNLYGTKSEGGAYGRGTVFKITTSGIQTVLYSFTGGSNGAYPAAGLIADAAGNLYGTTSDYGFPSNGTVFKVTPSGIHTVLHTFTGADGATPFAGLIADAAGNFYGTTYYGGTNGNGAVFKMTPSGTLTTLYSFTGVADGAHPVAGLLADGVGSLYGTALYGGTSGKGTVFKLAISANFNGIPGTPNCKAQSISFLAKKYGGLAAAARALGYPNVDALQNAVAAYCSN